MENVTDRWSGWNRSVCLFLLSSPTVNNLVPDWLIPMYLSRIFFFTDDCFQPFLFHLFFYIPDFPSLTDCLCRTLLPTFHILTHPDLNWLVSVTLLFDWKKFIFSLFREDSFFIESFLPLCGVQHWDVSSNGNQAKGPSPKNTCSSLGDKWHRTFPPWPRPNLHPLAFSPLLHPCVFRSAPHGSLVKQTAVSPTSATVCLREIYCNVERLWIIIHVKFNVPPPWWTSKQCTFCNEVHLVIAYEATNMRWK